MSSLRDKLKKLSFYTHYPRNHETLTINNVTEEYPSKKEIWDEWFRDKFTTLKFTGTNFTINQTYYADFSNSIVVWGDGVMESPTQLTHTYSSNTEHTIRIFNAPYSSHSCFRETPITSIRMPSDVTEIGSNCFNRCTGLTSLNIPSSVNTLSRTFFRNCPDLTVVKLNWTTSDTIVSYNYLWVDGVNSDFKFSIPNGTTSLYTAKGYPSQYLQEEG